MIIKIKGKAVITGAMQTITAEACTLMFQLRDALERGGLDEESAGRVMELISLAALSRDEDEHLEKLERHFGKEAAEDDHQDQD